MHQNGHSHPGIRKPAKEKRGSGKKERRDSRRKAEIRGEIKRGNSPDELERYQASLTILGKGLWDKVYREEAGGRSREEEGSWETYLHDWKKRGFPWAQGQEKRKGRM